MTASRLRRPAPTRLAVAVPSLLALSLGAAACSGSTPPSADAASSETTAEALGTPAQAAAAVFADLDGSGAPGCAAAVSVDGEVVFADGFGTADLELGTLAGPLTN